MLAFCERLVHDVDRRAHHGTIKVVLYERGGLVESFKLKGRSSACYLPCIPFRLTEVNLLHGPTFSTMAFTPEKIIISLFRL